MARSALWLALAGMTLGGEVRAGIGVQESLALVTQVQGQARIGRSAGPGEEALAGTPLFSGDTLQVVRGAAALIYLSGRLVQIGEGERHILQPEGAPASPLVERLVHTLQEIAGPVASADRPVVHGMARQPMELSGALPANTRLSQEAFSFRWDPLEGMEEYEFVLETPEGDPLLSRTVQGTGLLARPLSLERGRRYVWSVRERREFMPRSSGRQWIEIASEEEAKVLRATLEGIEKTYEGDTRLLLQVAFLLEQGYYYEAGRRLHALQERRALSSVEERMLRRSYEKMGRWERLADTVEKE